MAALLNVISLASAGLTITGFAQSNLPEQLDTYASVKIQVGLDGTTPDGNVLKDGHGNEPYTRGFNDNHVVISSVDGGRQEQPKSGTDYAQWEPRNINSGGFVEQTLKLHKNEYHNQQATIIESGGDSYGWLGDAAQACGQPWGYSQVHVGGDDGSTDYQPKFAWIDGNGKWPGGLSIYMPKFTTKDSEYKGDFDKQQYCNKPIMDFFPNSNYRYAENYIGTHHTSRSLNDRALITSRNPQQSARELCEDSNSAGPDFISLHEGLFCDMVTRELKPLCLSILLDNCFALGPQLRVIGKHENVRQAGEYGQVQEW